MSTQKQKDLWESEASLLYSGTLSGKPIFKLEQHFILSLPTGPSDDSVYTPPPSLHIKLEHRVVRILFCRWSSNEPVSLAA